jgi:hypothetical protein
MGMTLSRALAGLFGKKEMRASFIRRFFCHVTPPFSILTRSLLGILMVMLKFFLAACERDI